MKFEKQFMQDLVWEEYNKNEVKVVEKNMVDQTRWETIYEMIFQHRGKFYRTSYGLGSTEYQDSQPYEYDGDENGMIECEEVLPVEKTITVYESKK